MQYISASRRNDLPRFHYRQFFDAWKCGSITYNGGYCGCFESRDIGSYNPACRHGRLYCYANPRNNNLKSGNIVT
jgi:hypothetical protein